MFVNCILTIAMTIKYMCIDCITYVHICANFELATTKIWPVQQSTNTRMTICDPIGSDLAK